MNVLASDVRETTLGAVSQAFASSTVVATTATNNHVLILVAELFPGCLRVYVMGAGCSMFTSWY